MKLSKLLLDMMVMEGTAVSFTPSDVSQAEADALIALYNATDGDNWGNNTNWLTDPVVDNWYGVTVSGGAVTQLFLGGNSLSGSIPTEIGNLTSLTHLLMDSNSLSGSIPTEIGNLTSLTNLYLRGNSLSGSIPTEIGNLISLTHLQLYSNSLSGSIPTEIGNLTSLAQLQMYSNSLSGSIPTEIGNLTLLTDLQLHDNSLSGSIPTEIGNLTLLTQLNLRSNSFSGSIPTEIGNLTSLTQLILYNNSFSGSIPTEIGNLTLLVYLQLYGNSFSGIGANALDLDAIADLKLFNNSFNQATVDDAVSKIYAYRASYTAAALALNIGGSNAAPSGTYQDGDPPTTGKEYIYELVNDPEAEGFNTWAITYTA